MHAQLADGAAALAKAQEEAREVRDKQADEAVQMQVSAQEGGGVSRCQGGHQRFAGGQPPIRACRLRWQLSVGTGLCLVEDVPAG